MQLTLKLLQSRFPLALMIRPVDAGVTISQSRQSTYNQLSQGKFPVACVMDHLGRKMVRLTDLADYIDGLVAVQHQEATLPVKKKGRPTKAAQVDAKRLGVTVRALRAQQVAAGGAV